MRPTLVRLSKADRASLTTKRGNKDYYKGTRQAFLPGGARTGAPGRHNIRGKGKYHLEDDKVRVFVAPPLEDINNSRLKPYVAIGQKLSQDQEVALFGKFRTAGGLTPEHFLRIAREHTYVREHQEAPPGYFKDEARSSPSWLNAQRRLGLWEPRGTETGIAAAEEGREKDAGAGVGAKAMEALKRGVSSFRGEGKKPKATT